MDTTTAISEKPTAELGQFLSFDAVPALIMERLTDIRNLASEIRTMKIFCDPDTASEEEKRLTIESLAFKPHDHPLVQIIKQTAHTFYSTRSEQVRRELLSELRELLAEQHKREIEAMKEANRLLIEWAKIKNRKGYSGSSSFEDELKKALS